jgi:tetratricopeptide (TPR) repeat protein
VAPGHRAALHRRALSVLEKDAEAADPARLAHHADAAGDGAAVLRHATAAAAVAAAAGAHREAARLYQRALAFAGRLPDHERGELLERYAGEGYLAISGPGPSAALEQALAIHRSRGDLLAQGRTLRLLCRQYGREGRLAEARASIREGVGLLEQTPPSAELALTYVDLAGLGGMGQDPQAREWGERAISLGEQTGCAEAVYAGLNLVGSIEIVLGDLTGLARLERSLSLAEREHDYFHVGRAHLHICWMLAVRREWRRAERYLDPAIAYCQEHGQDLWLARVQSIRIESLLALGRWDEAAAAAESRLGTLEASLAGSRCGALVALAVVRARRGEPGCWPLLD